MTKNTRLIIKKLLYLIVRYKSTILIFINLQVLFCILGLVGAEGGGQKLSISQKTIKVLFSKII